MSRFVLLDSTPLGILSHPDRSDPLVDWAEALSTAGFRIGIPEIADYEVRRELLRAGKVRSIQRLDGLKREHLYLPITTAVVLLAAELWAEARRGARPTSADKNLDGDMILAAQALLIRGQGHEVVVATSNVKHLSRFVDARKWQDIKDNG
jgi:predicted nucleic acid-binding protein